MGKKHKKRASFVTTMAMIVNLIVNLLSPLTSYAQPQTYAMESTQTFTVNGTPVDTSSTVQLSPGDTVEYRLDYTMNNEDPIYKEGDTFTFNLPDIFSNITPSYPSNHFKDMQQNGNQITLVCGPDISTALGGYLTVSATVEEVEHEVPGQIIINISGEEIVIDTIVTPPGTVDRLIDKQVNNSDNDYTIAPDDKGAIVGQEVPYTVVVNEKYTVLENALLKDAIPEGMEYVDKSMTVKEVTIDGEERDVTANITSTNPLTVDFGTINKKYVVTYNLKVTEEKERYVNTATISSSNNDSATDSVTAIPAEDTKGDNDLKKSILGNSTLTPDDKGSLINQTVDYKVEVNSSKTQKDNAIFTDTIPEGMELVLDSVKVIKEVRGVEEDVTSTSNITKDKNSLQINFGDTSNKYIVEYTTKIVEDKDKYDNNAKLTWGSNGSAEDNSTITPEKTTPGESNVDKKVNGEDNINFAPDFGEKLVGQTFDYSVIVNDKMLERTNLKLVDTLPEGMKLADNTKIQVYKAVGSKYVLTNIEGTYNSTTNEINVVFPSPTSDKYKVTYTGEITKEKSSYENKVTLTSDNYDSETDSSKITITSGGEIGVGDGKLTKSVVSGASNNIVSINSDGTFIGKEIGYKAVVNNDYTSRKNAVFIDNIPEGMSLNTNSVKVLQVDKYGNKKDVTSTLTITKTASQLKVEFGDITDKYEITYTTTITKYMTEWTNDATLTWNDNQKDNTSVTVTPEKEQTPEGTLSKSVDNDKVSPDENGSYIGKTFNYEIIVNNELKEKENLIMTDTIPKGMELVTSSVKVQQYIGNNKYQDVTSQFTSKISTDNNKLVINFGKTSNRYKVTYQTKITSNEDEYNNNVSLTWNNGGESTAGVKVVPNTPQAGNNTLTKKVNNQDEITVKANDNLIGTQYNYSLIVNDKLENKKSTKLTDTLPTGMKLVEGSIKIEKDYGGGVYGDVTSQFKDKITTTNNSYTINFGSISDRYRVTYKAEITKIVEAGYRNVATLTSENTDKEEADANIKVDTSEITPGTDDDLIKKESNRATISDIGDKVKYTVTINEAKKKLLALKFEDEIPTGMKLVAHSVKITDVTNNKDVTDKFKNKITATDDKLSIDFGDVYTTTYKVEYEVEITKLMTKYENKAKITAQDVTQESKNELKYKVSSGGINATKTADKTEIKENENQDVTYSIKVWSSAIFPAEYLNITDELDERVVFKGVEAPDFITAEYDEATHTVKIVNNSDIPATSKADAIEIKIKVSFENVAPGEKVCNVAKINDTKTPPVCVKKGYVFEGLKVDADNDDAPLANAKFQLYKVEQRKLFNLIPLEGESLVEVEDGVLTSDENGKITSLKEKDGEIYSVVKEPGTYVLKEIDAPEGYDLLSEEIRFEIKDSDIGTTVNIGTIENTQTTSSVRVKKVDSKYTNQRLEGAEFTLSGNGKSYVKTTDSNGTITFENIKPGTYTLKETKAPDGYTASDEVKTVKVKLGQSKVYKYEFVNQYNGQEIQIKKVDADDQTKVLEGAEFTIYKQNSDESKGDKVITLTTNSNGLTDLYRLPVGNYIVEETKAPDRYIASEESIKVEIKEASNEVLEFTVKNTVKRGSLELIKTDVDTKEPLEGVKFNLLSSDKETVIKENLVTDKEGKIKVDDLEVGTYYFQEIETIEGYVLDKTLIKAELDTTNVVTVNATNEKIKGSLEITKIDKDDKTPLENVEFTIRNEEGKVVASSKTDKDGIVLFEELPYGKYTYEETLAARGYVLDDKAYPFEISEDGQVIRVEVTNEKVSGGNIPSGSGTTTTPNTPNSSTSSNSSTGGGNTSTGESSIVGYAVVLLAALSVMIGVNKKKKVK